MEAKRAQTSASHVKAMVTGEESGPNVCPLVLSGWLLHEKMRRAMGITQERLAKALRINQAGVSKIESRSDIFVSTLRKAIEAMGGKMEIHAKFPAGEVRIRQFGGLARKRVRDPGAATLAAARELLRSEKRWARDKVRLRN